MKAKPFQQNAGLDGKDVKAPSHKALLRLDASDIGFPKHSRHQTMEDCRMPSNKSGVLVTSSEVTTIHVVRSYIVATGVSYTSDFKWHQKKSRALRPEELGGQVTSPPRQIHLPETMSAYSSNPMKRLEYELPVPTVENLIARVSVAAWSIRVMLGIF
ncbi:hypothetical protein TNCV_3565921 [Trichonephila clavipes]|nr:hypothetical protein TNCV_3565921 [Trichonephila clavipes]